MKRSLCQFLLDLLLVNFLLTFSLENSVNAQCPSNKFSCGNGKCIPLNWRCDGEVDCADDGTDNSDEENCEVRTCSAAEFDCGSDQCIPMRWSCDGVPDCDNESDEEESFCSDRTCQPDHFDCGQDGSCIPIAWVCDAEDDCLNGHDEESCEIMTCSHEEFMCADKSQCISARWFCDRENDCDDGSDEHECPDTTCEVNYFQCETSLHCIPEVWRCDGDSDCQDHSDENGCASSAPEVLCTVGLFQCGNGDCIHDAWQCDGEDDCGDGTDENRTTCPRPTCSADQQTCQDGSCAPGHQCDGRINCVDGSDEAFCPTLPPVAGCSDAEFPCSDGTCIPLIQQNDGISQCPNGEDESVPITVCDPGYENIDGSCQDINECKDYALHACSQECVNHEGGFTCNCFDGFQLSSNNHCKAHGPHPLILYVHQHSIRQFNISSKENLEVYRELSNPLALEVDVPGGKLFWSDNQDGTIMMGSLDTSDPEVLVADALIVDGLAYDWIHKNLYWTDTNTDTINVISLDTRHQTVLFSEGLLEPRALVVDPRTGFMYWTDWGESAKIERAGMDGDASTRQTIIDGSVTYISWPNGLTIDYYSDRLFWVDAKHHLLSSCDFYGQDFTVVSNDLTFVEHPFQVAVFEDMVYWTDWDGHSIRRANKFSGETQEEVVGTLSSTPYGIAVWQNSTQPLGVNYCLDYGCSHISVAAPNSLCSCLCPVDLEMSADGLTCGSLPPPVTDNNDLPTLPPYKPINPDDNKTNPTTDEDSNHVPSSRPNQSSSLLWLIILGLLVVLISAVVIVFFVWRRKASGGKRSMNFDNPVYRKTTDDELFLSNGGHTYEHNPGKASKYQPMIQTDDVI